jgi:hypothetical protein
MSRFFPDFLICLLCLPAIASAGPGPALDERVKLLIAAYPDTLSHADGNRLYFSDNSPPLEIDDGRKKSHADKLANADIEDMLSQIYPAGRCERNPVVNFDPGRIRSDVLMRRLFGSTAGEVRKHMRKIDWFGETLQVTNRHGVADALIMVRDVIKTDPGLLKYVKKSGGTFNWRNIAGTSRLSVHSFGAAIDLNTKYANYWRWANGKPGNVPRYENQYPMKLIAIFEKHGFIWGGRWYHYDTMHFEYRPELLAIAGTTEAGISCLDPVK